jgi:hypothetical protein
VATETTTDLHATARRIRDIVQKGGAAAPVQAIEAIADGFDFVAERLAELEQRAGGSSRRIDALELRVREMEGETTLPDDGD